MKSLPRYLSKIELSSDVELELDAGAAGALLDVKYLFRRRDMLEIREASRRSGASTSAGERKKKERIITRQRKQDSANSPTEGKMGWWR